MINLLTRIPEPAQSTSFYRAIGPLQHLRKIMDLTVVEPSVYNWLSCGMCDLAFIQRPHTEQDLQLLKFCKYLQLPTVIDFDDDLFHVPRWNPAYRQFKEATKTLAEIISLADAVMVSTEALALELNQYRQNCALACEVIPNAFPSHLVPFELMPINQAREKIITWRGSSTHIKDLEVAYPALSKALDRFPDWRLVMLGEPPYEAIERFGERLTVIPWQDPVIYLKTLKDLRPSIHIVPLYDDTFNHCKSNIAYLEGTYAGAQVIAPDWPDWDLPGCYTYDGQISFEDRLLWLMGHGSDFDPNIGINYIAKNLSIEVVNLKRKKLFETLAGR